MNPQLSGGLTSGQISNIQERLPSASSSGGGSAMGAGEGKRSFGVTQGNITQSLEHTSKNALGSQMFKMFDSILQAGDGGVKSVLRVFAVGEMMGQATGLSSMALFKDAPVNPLLAQGNKPQQSR
ncbi:hypothetical protein [Rickettsiales endosymbiont of Stachyamoeba lipophora]|uniref:hypothetical protein n=1 Tax=Rickettsiales endosymbiont of Stachyamoeba lipophora TaxID=2486578 RepID=UPI000F64A766|nr:hypothetical protein [Rickettsiales endosymbiont of Stachyamoeba lipophora]AZL15046.1 hypothetical protein EF513_00485 [Rickettsiales endosymbiont of Stachyamoeba lipophora]